MTIMGVTRFERFFRAAAGLDVHKDDLKRYSDFINHNLYDLLLIGQAKAKANDRDVIAPFDLPITKGLQESIHQFRKMDEGLDLEPIIKQLETLPPLDLAYGDELVEQLPEVAGGLSYALATAFKTVDHKLKSPHSEQWEQAFALFDLLL
jgi:hypothetical protein